MEEAVKNACLIKDCKGRTDGGNYCKKHIKGKKPPTVITAEARLFMRSQCCKAACEHGKRHEYGEQYCAKCKEPCEWRVSL